MREAHPKDEWEWGGDQISCSIRQPRTLEERCSVALRYRDSVPPLKSPLVVDGIDDAVENLYKAWPERLYIIHNDTIVYAGKPGPFGYKPEEVDRFLDKYFDH